MPSNDRDRPDMRLDALDPRARKLVEAADLAGRPIPVDVAAALIDMTPNEAIAIGDRLIDDGLLDASGNSFVSAGGSEDLSSVRTAYLYGELASAFTAAGYAARVPALLGDYLLKAGDTEAAITLIDAAASSEAEQADVIELIEAGVSAIEEEGVGSDEVEGRLRLERAKYYQTAGWADRAAEDLRTAIRLLEGAALIDALGFLAAVEDNRQESQTAEVYAAVAIGEATAIGEPVKAGSLLLLQARILNRIGYPGEADASLAKGVGILEERGNRYQRFLATQNMARIALDRGKAVRAQPLFDRVLTTAEDAAGLAALADAAAWLARAQFMHGRPNQGLQSVATAIELSEVTGATVFLAHMAHSEGAGRFAAYEEALEAADAMLGEVLRQLPDWENAARYLRARALLGLDRIEEAAEEVDRALDLSPQGIDGWRWRLRIEAFEFSLLAARGTEWPKQRAEDLTDELLQGQWLDVAAELMAVRAGAEEDAELARQSAALALQLGIPTTAAGAIEAGGLWSDSAAVAVGSRIKETARHVPEGWQEAWSTQTAIAAALATPDVIDEELTAAATALQADLEAALLAAGLADPDTALSPAQRRQQGLVRRKGDRARRGALLLGAAAAVVILAIGGGFLAANVFAPQPTDTTVATSSVADAVPAIEDTFITTDLPEAFSGSWETLGGNQARTGASDASGVRKAAGYYWSNSDSQAQYNASPIVLGQNVIVGARDGQVYFFEQSDGEVPRATQAGDDIRITAAAATIDATGSEPDRHLAFVQSTDGVLYALDVQSGEGADRRRIAACCNPAVDVETGLVFVGGSDGLLHALKLGAISEEVWALPQDGFGNPITTAVTLEGGFAYFGVGNELWQFDLSTLEATQCEVPAGGDFLTPVVSDGIVYAANTERLIFTFQAETCDWLRNINVGDAPSGMPAVAGGMVYQPHRLGVSAYTFNPQAERVQDLWTLAWIGPKREGETLIRDVEGPPVIAGDIVYFGARDGYVYAVGATTGEIIWTYYTGAPILNSVAVTNKAIYVATTGGKVIAIAPVASERLAENG